MKKLFKNGEMFLLTPQAYGGYESDGLVFQLDCDKKWFDGYEWKMAQGDITLENLNDDGEHVDIEFGNDGGVLSPIAVAYQQSYKSTPCVDFAIRMTSIKSFFILCNFGANKGIFVSVGNMSSSGTIINTIISFYLDDKKGTIYLDAFNIGEIYTITIDGNRSEIFVNGVAYEVSMSQSSMEGSDEIGISCTDTEVYSVRFYSALSEEERIYNYAIDQTRFNKSSRIFADEFASEFE